MNAIDLLKADHERVKAILNQLSESTERGVKKRTEPPGQAGNGNQPPHPP